MGRSVGSSLCCALALGAVFGLALHGCGSDSEETVVTNPPGTTTTSQGGGGAGAQGGGGGTGGNVGGGGGEVGGGGSGGGPVQQGHTGYDLVNAGMQVTSTSYRMVFSFGQSSMHQGQCQSSGHSFRGGLIATME